jgi:hypothetical protein
MFVQLMKNGAYTAGYVKKFARCRRFRKHSASGCFLDGYSMLKRGSGDIRNKARELSFEAQMNPQYPLVFSTVLIRLV